jgi:hypothetical protein
MASHLAAWHPHVMAATVDRHCVRHGMRTMAYLSYLLGSTVEAAAPSMVIGNACPFSERGPRQGSAVTWHGTPPAKLAAKAEPCLSSGYCRRPSRATASTVLGTLSLTKQ